MEAAPSTTDTLTQTETATVLNTVSLCSSKEIAAPEGMPTMVGNQPAHYFLKDVIHPGEFSHPIKRWHLSVNDARLKHWETTGNQMLAAGLPIGINPDHKEGEAEDALGYVKRFTIDGDNLMCLCQMIGDDAAKMASRNYVSVGIYLNREDGKGRKWDDAIWHLALTPEPVIPDQSNFQLIAASLGLDPKNTRIVGEASFWSTNMNSLPCSDSDMDMLCSLVPDLHKIPREQMMSHVARHLQTVHGMYGINGAKHLSAIASAVPLLASLSDREASLASKFIASEIAAVKTNLRIDDESANKLAELLCKTGDGKPNAYLLSQTSEGVDAPAFAICDILKTAKVIPTTVAGGPRTSQQGRGNAILASRTSPGSHGEESSPEVQEDLQKRMADVANRGFIDRGRRAVP